MGAAHDISALDFMLRAPRCPVSFVHFVLSFSRQSRHPSTSPSSGWKAELPLPRSHAVSSQSRQYAISTKQSAQEYWAEEAEKRPVRLSDFRKAKPAPRPKLVETSHGAKFRDPSVRRTELDESPSEMLDQVRSANDSVQAGQDVAFDGFDLSKGPKLPTNSLWGRISEAVTVDSDTSEKPRTKAEKKLEKAKKLGLYYMSKRPYTRKQLEKKFADKEYEPKIADQAIAFFIKKEILLEAEYAESFARMKWHESKWSPQKISRELQMKGIAEEVCTVAIQNVFDSEAAGIKTSKESSDVNDLLSEDCQARNYQLLQTLRRRLAIMPEVSEQAQKRRLVAWLQRRGYEWNVISDLMTQLGFFD